LYWRGICCAGGGGGGGGGGSDVTTFKVRSSCVSAEEQRLTAKYKFTKVALGAVQGLQFGLDAVLGPTSAANSTHTLSTSETASQQTSKQALVYFLLGISPASD
jgi:hypothetical protein